MGANGLQLALQVGTPGLGMPYSGANARLLHFLHALQNLARFGFPIVRHADVPPAEKVAALLAGRHVLIHGEEGDSSLLKQRLR